MRLLPFLLLFVAGCSTPDTTGILLIGHGGQGPGGAFPMNSAAAVMAALDSGLNGVEIDVQFTADSVLVAYHDLELQGGGPCTGPVNTHTATELAVCAERMGVGIAHVADLVDRAAQKHPEADLTFDVKLNTKGDWTAYLDALAGSIARLERAGHEGRIVVECRVAEFLEHVRKHTARIPLFLYCDEPVGCAEQALAAGFAGITVHVDHITAQQVRAIRAQGLLVTVFGTGSGPGLRKAVRLRPDRIQVDG